MVKAFRFQVLALLLLATPALADDTELYDPAPPADASFVRVIQADSAAKAGAATLAGKSYKISYPAVTEYQIIPAGTHTLEAGKTSQEVILAAGKYYSLVLSDKKAETLEDALLANPAKARLYFYNLSDADKAALHAPVQKADILKDVAPGASSTREVNALTLDLAVMADGSQVKAFKGVTLKRRRGTSLVLTGSKGKYRALMVENNVAKN